MKLIDVKQAKEFASTFLADKILQAAVNAVVNNCPGTEIVRCRDCKHYDNSEGFCWCHLNSWHGFPEEGFCSYGERRTDGN